MKLLERRRALMSGLLKFIRLISGKPPITLEACIDDKSTIDYKLYGESVQDGTPTPEAPIEVESVGEKTINLFDFDSITGLKQTNGGDISVYYTIENGILTNKYGRYGSGTYFVCNVTRLEAGTYTLSCNVKNSTQSHIYLQLKTPDNYIGSIRPIILNQWNRISSVITFVEDTDILGISIQGVGNSSNCTKLDIQICDIQLELNSVATPYEPYGKYKIPVVASGKNLINLEKVSGSNITIQNGVISQNDITKRAYIDIPVSDTGTYTLSFSSNKQRDFWMRNGQVDSGYISHIEANELYKTFKISTLVDGYIRLDCLGTSSGYEAFVLSNIQLERSNATTDAATNYEPYIEPITTNIFLDEPLRKIGNYADYVDFENQVVVRNIKRVDLKNANGTYTWIGKKGVIFRDALDKWYTRNNNALCNRNYHWTAYGDETLTMWLGVSSNGIFWIGILDYLGLTTLDEFIEWLSNNPTYVLYGSDIPTETSIELPQLPTFKGTTIYSIGTNIQPSNMEVVYYSKERSMS